jgi:hypothetical protein
MSLDSMECQRLSFHVIVKLTQTSFAAHDESDYIENIRNKRIRQVS